VNAARINPCPDTPRVFVCLSLTPGNGSKECEPSFKRWILKARQQFLTSRVIGYGRGHAGTHDVASEQRGGSEQHRSKFASCASRMKDPLRKTQRSRAAKMIGEAIEKILQQHGVVVAEIVNAARVFFLD